MNWGRFGGAINPTGLTPEGNRELRIRTANCVIRSFESGDAASLAYYANDREVWINLRDSFPHPYSEADALQYITWCRAQVPETQFAIQVEGLAAGAIGLRPGEDVERLSAEIGYWVGREFWGRGIATAAVEATTQYAVRRLGLTRVFALPFDRNRASVRVLEKAGFVLEGRLRCSALKDGRILDQLMYAFVVSPPAPAGTISSSRKS